MPSKPVGKLTSKSVSRTKKQSADVTPVKFTVKYGDTSVPAKPLQTPLPLSSRHKGPPPPYTEDEKFPDLLSPKQKEEKEKVEVEVEVEVEEEQVEAMPGFWMPISLHKIWLKQEEEYAREKESMKNKKEEEGEVVLLRPFDNGTKYIRTRDAIEGSPKVVFHDECPTIWGIDLIWPNASLT